MLKIEKNVPMPQNIFDEIKAAFNQMDIGDSFITSGTNKSFVNKAAKSMGIAITIQKEESEIRVWKSADTRAAYSGRGRPPLVKD